ncbi:response regulator [Gallaecimonas mangrovi]|uniref:response regulator n=1 Tax=Gallaecimonas mangrovi TaxID=2291597 RepID=UPI000E20987D|nr:response regulator [Gallaecimonas mangrovi]
MYLLLVEDDIALGQSLLKLLSGHYRVDWVRNLQQAQQFVAANQYDVMLLDLGLPDGDGVQWLKQLRQQNWQTPVLIISARDGLDERIQGLDTGADDYLTKPFEPEELLARIRVTLRRQAGSASPMLSAGSLIYLPDQQHFTLAGKPLDLSPKEKQLLTVLIQNTGKAVARERLMRQLYGLGNEMESNTLEVHIHALRKQLGKARIATVWGFGYKLVTSDL